MDSRDGSEHITRRDAKLPNLMQFMGKNIQQDLRVRIRIEMPLVLQEQLLLEHFRIGQIAIVRQRNAIG